MKNTQILVAVSKFNQTITQSMLEACLETLYKAGFDRQQISTVYVPGAFELPLVASKAGPSDRWQAIICLGCVIRGETPHFDYVCQETARGIMNIGLECGKPVIFGVLTTETEQQAAERAGLLAVESRTSSGLKQLVDNKGADAASVAVQMLQVLNDLEMLGGKEPNRMENG